MFQSQTGNIPVLLDFSSKANTVENAELVTKWLSNAIHKATVEKRRKPSHTPNSAENNK